MDEESKQKYSISYEPNIKYTQDYSTDGSINVEETVFKPIKRQPYDTTTIPEIKEDIEYIDQILKAIPIRIANAIKEVYDPIREIYDDILWDKIVDPNPPKPPGDIIPRPTPEPDSKPGIIDFTVHPIILLPLPKDNVEPEPEPEKEERQKFFNPIVILPIPNEDEDDEEDETYIIYPIVLLPIPTPDSPEDDNKAPTTPSKPTPSPTPDDEPDDDPGMWDPPEIMVKSEDVEIIKYVKREYTYLISKLVQYYLSTLKDLLNNYVFTVLRISVGHTKDEKNIILNPLKMQSKDIYTKCKHLLDISIKDENMANLKLSFMENSFNIANTLRHTKSFIVAQELRERYTAISYSTGKSKANSASDSLLKSVNANYEIQFANTYENLFRYLNSSLVILDDVFKTILQDTLSKQTLVKKGGKK